MISRPQPLQKLTIDIPAQSRHVEEESDNDDISIDVDNYEITDFISNFRDIPRAQFTILDLTGHSITSFEGVNRFPSLEKLILCRTLISSFKNATELPNLIEIDFRETPLSSRFYVREMTLFALGFSIQIINGVPISPQELNLSTLNTRVGIENAVRKGEFLVAYPNSSPVNNFLTSNFGFCSPQISSEISQTFSQYNDQTTLNINNTLNLYKTHNNHQNINNNNHNNNNSRPNYRNSYYRRSNDHYKFHGNRFYYRADDNTDDSRNKKNDDNKNHKSYIFYYSPEKSNRDDKNNEKNDLKNKTPPSQLINEMEKTISALKRARNHFMNQPRWFTLHQTRVSSQNEEIESLRMQIHGLRPTPEYNQLISQLSIRQKQDEKYILLLQNEIEAKKNNLADIQKSMRLATEMNFNLQLKTKDAKAGNLSITNNDIQQIVDDLVVWKEKRANQEEANQKLKNEIKLLHQNEINMNSQINQNSKNGKLHKDLNRSLSAAESLKKDKEASEKSLAQLKARDNQQQNEINQIRQKLRNQDLENEKLRNQLIDLEKDVAATNEKNVLMKKKIEKQKSDFDQQMKELANMLI
ncbi:hypothetical protein TRFO_20993 [Tritrichomonas foetus]|uniref:Leucine Rich Repeat family protein n=1 Tax=Tritrichomonas foetus TaxID=1144522 RepID=A0A1J4KKT9_9EUKA|nr:hypothetical protein TRFO_20993 [Tritrichomonas foetus]|eukprot:OHT09989.1 hypothetical protein TRFO_20993 [Tritrichomonas foetus]